MAEAISNTSPLLYLHQVEALHLLPALFGGVWAPQAVLRDESVPSTTQRAALIEIQEAVGGFYGGRGLRAQFRNVPLPAP